VGASKSNPGIALYESELCSRSRTSEQTFVSVYRVYSVSIDNILMSVCCMKKTVYDLLFVCVLCITDGVNHRPRRIFR
jgi:hypothetical protein